MRKSALLAAALLGLFAAGSVVADIPFFWLDKPQGRDNKNDPNSPLFVRTANATDTPNATQTAAVQATQTANMAATQTAGPVQTQTANAAATQTAGPAATQTANAAATQTAGPAATQTANAQATQTAISYNATLTAGGPTNTNTFTDTPTATPTATNTATNTATSTPTLTPTPTTACGVTCTNCIKYEDFESGLLGFYNYADTGATATAQITNTVFHTCGNSLMATINTGTGNYAAVGFGSSYYVSNVVSAPGANYVHLWMKAGAAVSFKLSWTEYWGSPSDPRNEGWTSGTGSYTTAGAWQEIILPLSGFSENIYNPNCSGVAGGCLGSQNNTMDLDKIGAIDINFTQTGYNQTVYIDDVAFDTTAPTATPTPGSNTLFTDYEDGAAAGSYTYTDGGCTISNAVVAGAAHAGAYGWEITTDTTTGFVWGAGCGHGPKAPATTVDASLNNGLTFYIRATSTGGTATTVNYAISIKESSGTASLNENWTANPTPIAVTPGSGTPTAWQKVTLPWSAFSENMYNPDCQSLAGGCAANGNNMIDKNILANFDFNITNSGFKGTIDIDDVIFQ
jgi:hypothetical protein